MIACFDVRRRELRAELHSRRCSVRDHSKERLMADAVVLDAILSKEFGSLPKISTWTFFGNGGRTAAKAYAERLNASGAYVGLDGGAK